MRYRGNTDWELNNRPIVDVRLTCADSKEFRDGQRARSRSGTSGMSRDFLDIDLEAFLSFPSKRSLSFSLSLSLSLSLDNESFHGV